MRIRMAEIAGRLAVLPMAIGRNNFSWRTIVRIAIYVVFGASGERRY